MFLSQISIKKPVLTWVMNLLLILFGLVGLSRLPVRELPSVDPPVVNVMTVYPGASAEIVETEVTLRLEDEISGIEGIKTLTSQTREGVSTINVLFTLDRPIEAATQDVRDRVARVRGMLPTDAEEPVISKQDSDAQAGLWIAVNSDQMTQVELTELAENQLKDALQTVPGVSSVMIGGAKRYAVRVWLDPAKMAAHGITVSDVSRALREQNVELPSGRIENLDREMTIETRGSIATADGFSRLVIRQSGDILVRLRDIGTAEDGVEDEHSRFRSNGRPTIGLGIVKQAQANTVEVSDGVKAELERLQSVLPPGVEMVIAYNEATYVESAIEEVWITLGLAFALVVFVIFLFLRNLRSTIVPALAIPVSILGTFAVLYFAGFSVNIITMLGLVLAIGIVVDDAIVVLENIHRHIEEGLTPMGAAKKGMDEIAFAVIVTTLSLVAIFIPLVFQTSTAGRMFVELAIAVSGAVILSSFVALTLTPMVAARLLRAQEPSHGRIYAAFEHALNGMSARYERMLDWSLRHRARIVVLGVAALVAAVGLFMALPSEFIPDEDKGLMLSFVIAPNGSTAEYTDRMVRKAEAIIAESPEVEFYLSAVAMSQGGQGDPAQGIMFVSMKEDRERTVQDIIGGPAGIGARFFGEVQGAIAVPLAPKAIATSFGQSFQLVIQNQDMEALNAYVKQLSQKLNQSGYLSNVRSSFEITRPQLAIEVDRDRAAALGISLEEISSTLQMLYGGMDLSRFKRNGREYDVIVQLARADRLTPQTLENVYVKGATDKLIQLSNVVHTRETVAPAAIFHHSRLRSATLEGTPVGIPIGTAVERVEALLKEDLPAGFRYTWEGEARELRETGGQMTMVMLLAALIVYLVLAAQFESWVSPMIVMLALPLAAVGGLGALWLLGYVNVLGSMLFAMANYMPDPPGIVRGLSSVIPRIPAMNINLFSQIGLLLLFGLATKNSILLVEFANQRREQGDSALDAMVSAGRTRFRPILMTAFSTIAGMLPIAIGFGTGAASRRPMGVVVVGGMVTSTVLVLFVVPVVYVLLGEFAERRARAKAAAVSPVRPGRQAAGAVVSMLLASAMLVPLLPGRAEAEAGSLTPHTFTLEEAVNRALEDNPDMISARQEIEAAEGVAIQTRAVRMPKLRALSDYRIQDEDSIETFSDTVQNESWSAGLRLVQSVYEGGKLRSATTTARLVQSRAFEQFQQVVAEVVRDVRTTYYDVLLAEQEIVVQEASVKQLEEELTYSRRRFTAGTVPELNVLRAEVEVANARPRLIRARNRHRTSKSELLTLMGADIPIDGAEDIPLALTDTLTIEAPEMSLASAVDHARTARPELAALRSAIALREEDTISAEAGRRPRVEVFGGYDARNSVLSDDLTDEVHGWVAGAQASWDVFDGALTRGKVRESRARLNQAHTALDKQTRQIELEVRTAYSDWIEAREVLESQGKVLEQAEEALRQADSRSQAGSSTQLDVLSAQTALTNARTTQVQSLRDYAVAVVRLEYAVGAQVGEVE